MSNEVLVIGGGGAGLMCAARASRLGCKVVLLEHNERLGQKILISGGGRCNFTNTGAGPGNYISSNPHFCKSALARFAPEDFIKLVRNHGIAFHEKKLGQLFCDISSRQIVEMLQEECRQAGAQLLSGVRISSIEKHDRFRVQTSRGPFESDALVVATGGLSFPKLGATDLGYRVAQQFGMRLVPRRPGLVPLTFGENFAPLSGVSVDCAIRAESAEFRENILFTHRGLSGPAILQISNYAAPGQEIEIDLLPDFPGLSYLEAHARDGRELQNVLSDQLPRRFVQAWAPARLPAKPIPQLSRKELEAVAAQLHHWRLKIVGTEGYAKAEVTVGGVDTNDLSSKTMAARRAPGLFFIGEVVDVTGWLGGYNFQWAWASAVAAAEALGAS